MKLKENDISYVIISCGENMNSIYQQTINEITIKKSRFIAVAIPICSEDEAIQALSDVRKEYPGANHYTYAYVLGDLGNVQKASDDGEPSRTAGFPIHEVLIKNELTDVIIIVIRYFGGIKLGTGGLIRAYSQSASEVLKLVSKTKKITTYECIVKCSYDVIGSIDKYLREQTELLDVIYDKDITFKFRVTEDQMDEVKEQLFNKNNYQDTLEIISEKTEYSKIKN